MHLLATGTQLKVPVTAEASLPNLAPTPRGVGLGIITHGGGSDRPTTVLQPTVRLCEGRPFVIVEQ